MKLVLQAIIGSLLIWNFSFNTELIRSEVPAVPPLQTSLIKLTEAEAWETLNSAQPASFKFTPEGILKLTGKAAAKLTTKSSFQNYHLVLDYNWGEYTFGKLADHARRCRIKLGESVLILQEGKSCYLENDKKTSSLLNQNFRDIKGFHLDDDIQNPLGEWNRLEIINHEPTLEIKLNGKLIHKFSSDQPTQGKISLETVNAELTIRRFELFPLNAFQEEWKPEIRSGNTGYSESGAAILPRRFPWSVEKSQQAWQIDGPYELQLVAAEPLICDPVDVVWDEQGRMFVAELRDYPFPPEHGPRLSRIRLLKDENQDGVMDKAVTWADELENVQGLLPFQSGLLVTSSAGVFHYRDQDHDDHAETVSQLFKVNQPRHSQLQLASPRWRLDNCIHLNNGIDGQKISSIKQPEQELTFKGFNLKYNPLTGELSTQPGIGQFGAGMDDAGHIFFCSNRNPAMFGVLTKDILERNRFLGAKSGYEDIQPAAAQVFPAELSHTTAMAHAGTHTSACGICVYTGSLIPELKGEIFVCDPTAQLITRNKLVTNGASFKAVRIGDHRDFLVSRDEWTRPVNLRNGPDGALYICDMYRRFIDHAVYFPEEFTKSNYMRAGVDQGRIWKLVPLKSSTVSPVLIPQTTSDLVTDLGHPNFWQRMNAQRLLVERKEQDSITLLQQQLHSENPLTRLHTLWTLQGLTPHFSTALTPDMITSLINDNDSRVVENVILLAQQRSDVHLEKYCHSLLQHPSARIRFLNVVYHGSSLASQELVNYLAQDGQDHWSRTAVISLSELTPGKVLAELLQNHTSPCVREVYLELAEATGAKGDPDQLAEILPLLHDSNSPVETAVIIGLSKGLPRSSFKSLSQLISKPPATLSGKLKHIEQILSAAKTRLLDRQAELQIRLDALLLVQDDIFPILTDLISIEQPPELQAAVCRNLSRYDRTKVADFLFANWQTLGPVPRKEGMSLLISHKPSSLKLLQKMKSGEISKSLMPLMDRWVLSRSNDPEIKTLTLELFGENNTDRAKIINEYQAGLNGGDINRGKMVFEKANCIICHQPQKDGKQIGPHIQDIRIKPPVAILTDILDPNRVVEERWTVYNIITGDGLTISGLILNETSTSVEIVLSNGERKTIPREDINSMTSPGISLMPEGFEKQITKEQMADLIAYLKSTR